MFILVICGSQKRCFQNNGATRSKVEKDNKAFNLVACEQALGLGVWVFFFFGGGRGRGRGQGKERELTAVIGMSPLKKSAENADC